MHHDNGSPVSLRYIVMALHCPRAPWMIVHVVDGPLGQPDAATAGQTGFDISSETSILFEWGLLYERVPSGCGSTTTGA